jgi:hypothetical protein
MAFTAADVESLIGKVRGICRAFRQLPDKLVEHAVGTVVKETMTTIKSIEDRIEEAGCIPGDVATTLLHYGAVAAIIEDLPIEDDRRELVTAGREIGKAVAEKLGEKSRGELERRGRGKGN